MMRWFDIEIDGAVRRVPAARAGGRLWFHWRGRTYAIDRRAGRTASSTGAATLATGIVSAPMPGKITRVAAEIGALVTKGQVLVVMEAMKMEYTLEADRDGRVAEVNATAGSTVGQGAVLVKVIPA